jgi:hypothetical protein
MGYVRRQLRFDLVVWIGDMDDQQRRDPSPRITGLAWIGSVPRQEQWAFELVLPNTVRSLEHVPWHTLLPAEDVTDWLSIDLEKRQIRIVPSVGVPPPKPLQPTSVKPV